MTDTLTLSDVVVEETPPLINPEPPLQPLGDWDGPIPNPDAVGTEEPSERPRRGRHRTEPEPDSAARENPFLTASGKVRKGALVRPLTKMYATIGAGVALADPVCSQAILSNAKACAEALDELAQQKPEVARALMTLLESGAWTAVIVAHIPILFAILMHHVPAFQRLMQDRMGALATLFEQDEEGTVATS